MPETRSLSDRVSREGTMPERYFAPIPPAKEEAIRAS
jgi:hypothetical protein